MQAILSGVRCCAFLQRQQYQGGVLSTLLGGVRTATKKAGGSSCNGRDSIGRRLGLKKIGGQAVIGGNIIIRQRGQRYRPGAGVGMGKDHTLYALGQGRVRFDLDNKKRQVVSVETEERWLQRCKEHLAATAARRVAAEALRLERIAQGWEKAAA
ncbi:ribosomal L27 protein-domain-containing protein [Tribonema minus]|uniref:50S ribosomal protein L27, chloroplastic n=1 Tax=Tribonema minus TaxID=303371 RepID=A0A835ZF26_9STRA|nr:ribosomal L27 protein-domain-containing protein [Tribonema minus]